MSSVSISSQTISIHAPTRGATDNSYIISSLSYISIHAPTRGATLHHQLQEHMYHISIHAPTRGATHSGKLLWPTSGNFNPRSHERSDNVKNQYANLKYISIHAPTRGATMSLLTLLLTGSFQSTLPREERLYFISIIFILYKFQSTLPREERPGIPLFTKVVV